MARKRNFEGRDLQICPICQHKCVSRSGLSIHLARKHGYTEEDLKKYYNKHFSTSKKEGRCKVCGKPTEFIGMNVGYRPFCGLSCKSSYHNRIRHGKSMDLKEKQEQMKKYSTSIDLFGEKIDFD
jgi:endogenous inhibitor of DNA gyrase (YacG/DUF329 family)